MGEDLIPSIQSSYLVTGITVASPPHRNIVIKRTGQLGTPAHPQPE